MKRMKKMVVILCIVVLGIAYLAMPVAAQTCGEDILSGQCECNACAANLNFKATPTCDGVQFTWNDDIGADEYLSVLYYPPNNAWSPMPDISGTSFFIHNDNIDPGTYSFAVISSNQQDWCYSNIVCDVEFPATCTNTPEFPSIFLPAAMIIGFLGAVLLIQRTREQ